MTKAEAYGYIENGKLHIIHKQRFDDDIRQFKNCDVEILVKKKGKRSIQQNRYYFGVVVKEIQLRFRELGHNLNTDDVHEFLKQKFNAQKVVVPDTAEVIEIGKTTTEMNKDEFSEYVEAVRQWASSVLEIYIPDPGQQSEMFAA